MMLASNISEALLQETYVGNDPVEVIKQFSDENTQTGSVEK